LTTGQQIFIDHQNLNAHFRGGYGSAQAGGSCPNNGHRYFLMNPSSWNRTGGIHIQFPKSVLQLDILAGLNRCDTRPHIGLTINGYQASVAGSHAAVQAPWIFMMRIPAYITDAARRQYRPDSLPLKSPHWFAVYRNCYFLTPTDPAFNAVIFYFFGFKHLFPFLFFSPQRRRERKGYFLISFR
jgi:hypothetical protein